MAFLDDRYLITNCPGMKIFDSVKDLPVVDPQAILPRKINRAQMQNGEGG